MKSLFLQAGWMSVIALALASSAWAQTPPSEAPATQPLPPTMTTPQGKVTPPPSLVDIANEPTVRVVANVLPAVVNINSSHTVPQYVSYYDRYFHQYRNGVMNQTSQSIGSGLLISADGYILTNAHVVALADEGKTVHITLNSGSKYEAQIINADEDADLALLKITDTATQFPYFDLTYTSPDHLGETVIALGSPAGFQNSVSQGILSALHRDFTAEEHQYHNLIQTDAAINPGNSGGPLVDLNGGLVGINSAKMAGEAIESIGFAIPTEVVVPWANEALAEARGQKPSPVAKVSDVLLQRLGLAVKTLTAEKAEQMSLSVPGGLLITHVDENGPAAQADLREGMVIIAIGSHQVTDEKTVPHNLQHLQAGDTVRVQVVVIQKVGMFILQRGGTAELTAR